VQLVDVDVVGVESMQARLEVGAEPSGDVAVDLIAVVADDGLAVLVDLIAELGGDDDVLAASAERRTEQPLAAPGAVVGGGVEERDAEVERPVQRPQRLVVVDDAPACWSAVERPGPTDRPAAHSERAGLDSGASEDTGERGHAR